MNVFRRTFLPESHILPIEQAVRENGTDIAIAYRIIMTPFALSSPPFANGPWPTSSP